MASLMRNVKQVADEDGLYPWGVAELTDKWVLLHQQGLPKWAIFYKGKGHTVVVPCQALKSQKRVAKLRKPAKKRSAT
jgi:hypothetical protein